MVMLSGGGEDADLNKEIADMTRITSGRSAPSACRGRAEV